MPLTTRPDLVSETDEAHAHTSLHKIDGNNRAWDSLPQLPPKPFWGRRPAPITPHALSCSRSLLLWGRHAGHAGHCICRGLRHDRITVCSGHKAAGGLDSGAQGHLVHGARAERLQQPWSVPAQQPPVRRARVQLCASTGRRRRRCSCVASARLAAPSHSLVEQAARPPQGGLAGQHSAARRAAWGPHASAQSPWPSCPLTPRPQE